MAKNPVGRPSKSRIAEQKAQADRERFDNWKNVLTGLGTVTHDKRAAHQIVLNEVSTAEAKTLWRSDDMGARVVEMPAREIMRPGFVVTASDDDDNAKKVTERVADKLRSLRFSQAITRAMMYRRAFGFGGVLLGVDDGQGADWSKALDLKRVRSFDFVSVYDPEELRPLYVYNDPFSPKFGEVQTYELWPRSLGTDDKGRPPSAEGRKIHASRVLAFNGPIASRDQQSINGPLIGDSVFTRIRHVLADFATAWASCGVLFNDFAQPVFKMKSLAEAFANNRGAVVLERMKALALAASTVRMVMIDSEEEYGRHQTPIAGFAELLDRYSARMAAAAEMPLSMLMGESPGGLNASGASGDQLRMWYDRMAQTQETEIAPEIERAAMVCFPALKLKEPEAWGVKFNPFWQPTEKELADTRAQIASADRTYIELGVLTPDEVRESRFGGDAFSPDTQVDKGLDDTSDVDPDDDTADMVTGGALEVPRPEGGKPAAAEPAKAAMTGVQVTSLIEVVTSVATGKIARESGAAILKLAFPLDDAGALELLGPENFKPEPDEPKVISMPGAGPKPGGAPGFPPKPAPAKVPSDTEPAE